jgi:nucleotide-binding universal stress UspA family protein
MVNILVPTDFSLLSNVAVEYAFRIADQLNGNITLLHVIDFQKNVRRTLTFQRNVRQHLLEIRANMEKVIADTSAQTAIVRKVRVKVSQGTSFSDTILRESKRMRSGLIVMGTRGASGMKKTFLGSNTVSVLGQSHVPVLAVPSEADFKTFRNIIYATDLKHLEKELEILIPYVKKFGSILHILHIIHQGNIAELEERIDKAVEKTGYKNIVSLVTIDHDVEGAIGQYIGITKADLVAMFTHNTTFYERILDKSVTRKMAFHSKIPLLAFKQ